MANEENLIPFKKGDPRINRDGRPRKMTSQIIKNLTDSGIEHVTKQQIVGAIETLLNCRMDELSEMKTDDTQPVLIRIIAEHMIKAENSTRIFAMLLDRAFGKPDQKTEHTGEVNLFEALTDVTYEKDN